jgi:F-type H+-transporting ATPase subunit delta
MTNRSAATRYARALMDVALQEKADVSAIELELAAFSELFTKNEEIAKALLNPAVPAPKKRAVVQAIVDRAGAIAPLGKLLVLLAERDRLVLLPDMVEAYRLRLQDHLNVVRAEVTTSESLAAERTDAIRRSLATVTGRQVVVTSRVDRALIGGMVARVGGTVFDASVARQLERIKERLTTA